jgi:chromosome segregation ATPase
MKTEFLTPTFLALLALSFILTGCDDEQKDKALAEAEQSRVELRRVKAQLAKAEREIVDLNDALETVKKSRDELVQQVNELSKDRGSAPIASEQAQQAVKNLSTRTSEQNADTAALEKQLNDLLSLIESQERTIAEQEATIAELIKTIDFMEGTTAPPLDDEQDQTDANDVRL